MRRLLRLFLSAILLSLPLAVACAAQTDSSGVESEREALLEADRAWAEAARKGDIPRLTGFWADDAVNYSPGAPPAKGRQEIAQLVQRNRNRPGFSLTWEPETAVVAQSGDLGYTSGTFALTAQDPQGNLATRTGHYVCIWSKQSDGSWKCSVETSVFSASSDQ